MKMEKGELNYSMSTWQDAEMIVDLIARVPEALIPVTIEEIVEWIDQGQSMVGKNEHGEIVAHQGMEYWKEIDVVEIRSAFVEPSYRGQGINTQMKIKMIEKAKQQHPEAKIVGFTEEASKSRGVLQKLGFEEIPMEQVPEPMFAPCPEICFKKTGIPCGCKVYVLPEVK